MAVQRNHTIVSARHSDDTATFVWEVLEVASPEEFGPFLAVHLDNGVALDFIEEDGEITPQHYAFPFAEPELDQIFGRIQELGVRHWADPRRRQPDRTDHDDDGGGVYFESPDGHLLEIITRSYGSGG